MTGVVCAAAVGRVKERLTDTKFNADKLLLDPNEQEIQQCDAVGCVAVLFKGRSIPSACKSGDGMDEETEVHRAETVWSSLYGIPLQSDYDAFIRLAKTGAALVYNAVRDKLREEVEDSRDVGVEPLAKKMSKHKGGRVALQVGTEDPMDTT